MSAVINHHSVRIVVRTVWRVSPKIASANRRASTFADFLRLRRAYKSLSAVEHRRNVFSLQDGNVTSRCRRRSILVSSQVLNWRPLIAC